MRTTKQEYRNFFKQNFDDFELRLPMFYLWDVGLRFDLQKEFKNPVIENDDEYFKECLFRAVQIFETTFQPTDKIYLVVNSFKWKKRKIRHGNYIFKQIKDLDFDSVDFRKINQLYEPGDKSDQWNQAIIITETKKVNYKQILTGQVNTDFGGRKPRICEDIFFVNITKSLVFNVYDDRGLDIIASDKETLRPIFEKHKEWILEYDREKIDKQFE